MMEKPELMQELPKCDTETQSGQKLLERWRQQTSLPRDGHKCPVCKKRSIRKVP